MLCYDHIQDRIITFRVIHVIDFGTNRKRVGDFLLVLNSYLGPILPRVSDIRAFVHWNPCFRYHSPISAKISDPWCWGLQRANTRGYLTVKLFSKNYNKCYHNPPTLQTDRRTDRPHIMAILRCAMRSKHIHFNAQCISTKKIFMAVSNVNNITNRSIIISGFYQRQRLALPSQIWEPVLLLLLWKQRL